MSDIIELEARIRAALDRIAEAAAGAADGADESPQDGAEMAHLREALEAERASNENLEARVAAIQEKQAANVEALKRSLEETGQKLAEAEAECGQLRAANAALSERLDALQQQAAQQTPANGTVAEGEAFQANRTMMAELEALRAARAAEKRELESVLTALEGVIGEAN